MENYTRINELAYKLDNTELKKIACRYGISWLCNIIRGLAVIGRGDICGITITPEYLLSLSQNDRDIIDRVIRWGSGQRLLFHTAKAPYDSRITRTWCTLEDVE